MVGSVEIIDRARARATRIAAAPAGAGFGTKGLCFSSAAHGKSGDLLLQFLALALGAGSALRAKHNGLKAMATVAANIFENRHEQPASDRIKLHP